VIVRVVPGEGNLDAFRQTWAALGDLSTVVVAGDGLWVAHLHTDHADAAVAAAQAAGRVQDVQITDLHSQQS
jgi:dihydroxyacetone kinase-like predicted kinase